MSARIRAVLWCVLAGFVAASMWVILDNFSERLTASEARAVEDRRTAIADRRESDRKVEVLSQQLEALGEMPAVTTDEPLPPVLRYAPPGAQGPRGPVGLDGADGANGVPGTAGEDGQDGAQGATGAQGPKGDTGPQGATGDRGPAGTDGRGISNLQCGADGRWTVTYTDGTSEDAGECRLLAAPEPES